MKATILPGTALILILTAASAHSQPPGGILQLDSDGDGAVSRSEFRPPQERRGPRLFQHADLDGDGSVTRDEVLTAIDEGAEERQERMKTHLLSLFDEMDGDGNGVVTQTEALDHVFARADADGDGFVTEAEAQAMREERRSRHREHRESRS